MVHSPRIKNSLSEVHTFQESQRQYARFMTVSFNVGIRYSFNVHTFQESQRQDDRYMTVSFNVGIRYSFNAHTFQESQRQDDRYMTVSFNVENILQNKRSFISRFSATRCLLHASVRT
jgi:hypothetical protein